MHTVTRTNVHGWNAVRWSLLPFAIAVYVALISRHESFKAPADVGYAIAILFLVAGLFLLFHGLAGVHRDRRRQNLLTLRPDEPWLADHEWDPAGIDDEAWRTALRAFWGPFLLALFAIPANWLGFSKHGVFTYGAVVLDLLLLWALRAAFGALLRAARQGVSRLEFDSFPFIPGEELAVRYRGPGSTGRVEATLRYVRELEKVVGGQKQRWTRIEQDVVWVHTKTTSARSIRFQLPADGKETSLSGRPAKYWELQIRAGDFETRFFLPVYRKAETAKAAERRHKARQA